MGDNGMLSLLFTKVKPYLAMVCLQFGNAGMYIITMVSLKHGMSHWIFVVYRHVVATIAMGYGSIHACSRKENQAKVAALSLHKDIGTGFFRASVRSELVRLGNEVHVCNLCICNCQCPPYPYLHHGHHFQVYLGIIIMAILSFLEPVEGQLAPDSHTNDHRRRSTAPNWLWLVVIIIVVIYVSAGLLYLCYRSVHRCLTQERRLNSLPVFTYPTDARVRSHNTECSICLDRFVDGVMVSVLPMCGHTYHPDCIHNWITRERFECPNCRQDYIMLEHQSPDFLP